MMRVDPIDIYQNLGHQDLDRLVIIRQGILPNVRVALDMAHLDPMWVDGKVECTKYAAVFPCVLSDLLQVEAQDLHGYVMQMGTRTCLDACDQMVNHIEAREPMTIREVLGWLLVLGIEG
jgi:hypothetical protein